MKKSPCLLFILSILLLTVLNACTTAPQATTEVKVAETEPVVTVEATATEKVEATATTKVEAEKTETAAKFPVTINNCGLSITYDAPPERAVTMNQAATEIMLALGLEKHMVGTAFMDDKILPEFADAYAGIPILSEKYPSQEVLLTSEPDFVYGVYRTAFGDEAAGPRAELLNM